VKKVPKGACAGAEPSSSENGAGPAGASKRHGTLAGNAFIALRQYLRGKPCGVWMADMKVRVAAYSAYYYPDVVATSDPADLGPDAPRDFLEAPKLVVEVFRRTPAGWTQDIYEAGEVVRLDSVGMELPMAELYADTGIH
jgi:Uma2 family endonuclease